MTIKADIEALEKALAGVRSYDYGPFYGPFDGRAEFWTACSPDRIRRVLDALKEWQGAAQMEAHLVNEFQAKAREAEAKLSKAIELLREAREWPPLETRQAIDSFLKEQGEPK